MKRKLILLYFALCAVVIAVSGQNKALFVYDKSGGVTPVMFTEVDSVRFSCLDIDSVLCSAPVTQEIWTPDSVYRLSLNDIDSVSFQTPATVLKSHTVDLTCEPIRQYVKGVSMETLTVELNASTPLALVPKAGDCLVAMECGGAFGNGFIGRVTQVRHLSTGIVAECEAEELTEAFENYYGIFQSIGYDDSDPNQTPEKALRKARRHSPVSPGLPEIVSSGVKTFKLPPIVLSRDLSLDWSEDYDLDSIFKDMESKDCLNTGGISSTGRNVSFKISPVISINYAVIIRKGTFYERLSYSQLNTVEADHRISHKVGGSLSLGKSLNGIMPEIPLFYFADLDLGIEMDAEGTIGLRNWNQTEFYNSFSYERSSLLSLGRVNSSSSRKLVNNFWDLNVGGKLGVDIHFTPMLKLLHKNILSLRADLHGGVELKADFLYRLREYQSRETTPDLYKALKGKGITFGPTAGLDLTANLGPLEANLLSWDPQLEPWWESLSVPNINELAVKSADGKSTVSMTVSGNCFTDHKVGFRVVRHSDESVTDWIDEERPFNRFGDSMDYSHEFDFEITEEDEVYPLVEYYKTMIRALPTWPIAKASIFYPYTSYKTGKGIRVISGATSIGTAEGEENTFHIGNLLPFHPF